MTLGRWVILCLENLVIVYLEWTVCPHTLCRICCPTNLNPMRRFHPSFDAIVSKLSLILFIRSIICRVYCSYDQKCYLSPKCLDLRFGFMIVPRTLISYNFWFDFCVLVLSSSLEEHLVSVRLALLHSMRTACIYELITVWLWWWWWWWWYKWHELSAHYVKGFFSN